MDTVICCPDPSSVKDLLAQLLGILLAPLRIASAAERHDPSQDGPYPVTDQCQGIKRPGHLSLIWYNAKGPF